LLPITWVFQLTIDILFPVVFILLFLYTFLNAPFKKRRGMGINALAALVALFVVWTFLPMLAGIVSGAFFSDNVKIFAVWENLDGLIPVAAAMATILGIAMAVASAPFQRYRGAGLGIVGFSIVLWVAWLASPLIIPGL